MAVACTVIRASVWTALRLAADYWNNFSREGSLTGRKRQQDRRSHTLARLIERGFARGALGHLLEGGQHCGSHGFGAEPLEDRATACLSERTRARGIQE